jgi:hypothetical protein
LAQGCRPWALQQVGGYLGTADVTLTLLG